jgi:predicted nucleic acid-binding protein
MKGSVYIETTVPSYYFEERNQLQFQRNVTKDWWENEKNNYNLYTSEIVFAELEAGEYRNKDEILNLIYDLSRLEVNEEIKEIVEIYLKNYLMPKKHVGDAFHLAIASYYKMDYLLTWNCEHLANVNKERHIRIVNEKCDLVTPHIITPLQLITEKEE